MIHMKCQDLFFLKNNKKKTTTFECCLLQILLGALRVKTDSFMYMICNVEQRHKEKRKLVSHSLL